MSLSGHSATLADILRRRGDVLARTEMAKHQALAQGLQGVTGALGDWLRGRGEAKTEEEQTRRLQEAAMQYIRDPTPQNYLALHTVGGQRIASGIAASMKSPKLTDFQEFMNASPEKREEILTLRRAFTDAGRAEAAPEDLTLEEQYSREKDPVKRAELLGLHRAWVAAGRKPDKPKEPPKPKDYQGRAIQTRRAEGLSLDPAAIAEEARALEEAQLHGGPPRTVGEMLSRPSRLLPRSDIQRGVVADERGAAEELGRFVRGEAKPVDLDTAVIVQSKAEADALLEGQIFQIAGRPEFYRKGVGEQVEQITE